MGLELSGRVGTGRADRAGIGRAATGQVGSVPADRAGAGLTDAMHAGGGRAELSGWWTWGRVQTSRSGGIPVRTARVVSVGGPDIRGGGRSL